MATKVPILLEITDLMRLSWKMFALLLIYSIFFFNGCNNKTQDTYDPQQDINLYLQELIRGGHEVTILIQSENEDGTRGTLRVPEGNQTTKFICDDVYLPIAVFKGRLIAPEITISSLIGSPKREVKMLRIPGSVTVLGIEDNIYILGRKGIVDLTIDETITLVRASRQSQ